ESPTLPCPAFPPCPVLPLLLDLTADRGGCAPGPATPLLVRSRMIPLDLNGKVALVTGVGDNESFAWYIAKALQAAGARLVFAVHPRFVRIVEGFLTSDKDEDVASRVLPFGAGTLKVEKVLPCDVSYDTMADVPQETRGDRRWSRVEEQYGDYSIEGLMAAVGKAF